MAGNSPRFPKYRLHKAKGLAVVTLDGKHRYLGPYGSEASQQAYHRLLAEWLAAKSKPCATPEPEQVQPFWGIASLIEAYLAVARSYYVDSHGRRTSEYNCIVSAHEPLKQLHALTNAHEFGPRKLKEVRALMISKGWARTVINGAMSRIRRMFRWAVSEELISPTVLHGLQSVAGLRAGRSEARELEPVKPVASEDVAAIFPVVSRQVRAMLQLMLLTGMRPGEVVRMRAEEIDRTGAVWRCRPRDHKNSWPGMDRVIPLGPKAQELLKPFLDRPANAYLFSPAEAEEERRATLRANRKSRLTPSQRARRRKVKPKRAPKSAYTVNSLRRAVSRAIRAVNRKREKQGVPAIPAWFPRQIRHTKATQVRERFGLDGAQVTLGHKTANITQVYAEANLQLAMQIAQETG